MGSLEPLPETQAALDELMDFEDTDVATVLGVLGERASAIVPEIVGLSFGLLRDGLTFTLVASDSTLAGLDAIQYLDGGPCVDAAQTGAVVPSVTDDPLDEERWRMFAQAAAAEGVASSLSLPIYRAGQVIGGVNLYASTETAFEGHHEQLAALMDARATEAVTNADLSFSTRFEAAAAPRRLQDQAQIDTAVGIIAAHRDISVIDARDHLTQAATRAGVAEIVVARVIVQMNARGDQA